MLVLDSPESNVLLATGHQFISLNWAELDCENIEVADLLGQEHRFPGQLYLADVEHQQGLSLVAI